MEGLESLKLKESKEQISKSIIIQNEFNDSITEKDARQWISNYVQINDYRSRYLGKLGFQTEQMSSSLKEIPLSEENKLEENNKELQIEKSYQSGDYIINFFQKTDDQIRKNYLDKLICNKILRPIPSKKQQSCKFFYYFSLKLFK